MKIEVRATGLKAMREKRGLTQRKLAHDLGISQNYIPAIEANSRQAGPKLQQRGRRSSTLQRVGGGRRRNVTGGKTLENLPRVGASSYRPAARPSKIVARAIAEYEALLDHGASELAIQKFLAAHPYFWNGLLRMGNDLYSKIRLGDEYEIDFVICDPSSDGAEWHLIEIERPTAKLLTKAGDPTRELTHALGQVREWQRWIERNPDYAQKLMPGIDHPQGYVFMGRRSELESPTARERLRAINMQNRANVEVGTLDRFAEQARSVLTWGPSHHKPRAKTHRELRAGLRPDMLSYIRSDMGHDRQFIKERRRRTRFDEDWPRGKAGDDESREVTVIRPVKALRAPIVERAPRRSRKPSQIKGKKKSGPTRGPRD